MNTHFRNAFVGTFISMCSAACHSEEGISTVQNVDLDRYSGTWYSIASYPQFFERGTTNVKATYTSKDGYIEVYNQSIKDAKPNDIKGKAFVVKNSGNAKLKVQFFWPFIGNYWIIGLDKNYTWAVVSDPKQKTLWILSRYSKMDDPLYNMIVEDLVNKGYVKDKIVKMVHN